MSTLLLRDHIVFKKLSDNLNMLMAEERLSANELAKFTDLPATTIKRIRSDDNANPTLASLMPIAKYFSITVGELIGDTPFVQERMPQTQGDLHFIPHFTWSECIHFELLDYKKYPRKILTEKILSNKAFALTIEEDELENFPKGAMIIVDPEFKASSGDYVIVAKQGQTSTFIKKFIMDVGQVYLKSLVSGLGVIQYTPEFKIIGVIIQYKVDLKA